MLNSLPGEAITKSLAILRAYGRFLEIGKTDIYQNRMIGLLPFQDNLTYSAIDLDRMLRQRIGHPVGPAGTAGNVDQGVDAALAADLGGEPIPDPQDAFRAADYNVKELLVACKQIDGSLA